MIGDPQQASAEFGQRLIDQVVEAVGGILRDLLEDQRFSRR